MINFLYVGMGGFIGSGMRYICSQLPLGRELTFPLATLLINFTGAFLIAIFSTVATEQKTSSFFKVGLCGGFTTFSTFTLETFNMIEAGKFGTAFFYSAASVILCLAGFCLGKIFTRTFIPA